MAVPTIDAAQSVLGYNQFETFAFQPGAFGSPAITSWSATGLPAGLTINATTGLISGAATVAGAYNVGVRASNSDGASPVAFFFIGIDAAVGTPTDSAIDLYIDTVTRLVSRTDPAGDGFTPLAKDSPAFSAKPGDTIMLNVRLRKGKGPLGITLSGLKLALREFDTSETLLTTTEFAEKETGTARYWQLPVVLTEESLADPINAVGSDVGTEFLAFAEIEWKETANFGTATKNLVSSTRSFRILLEPQFVPS